MALSIGNKTFMNLQEAVGWLLENNAIPFQSTANYAGNTEIAMSTLINPSPAKVRVGSIIFFADSKVSTVIGVTSNSFICSDQYNDLVDDIVYVSNVAINASGHLITTLSNGDTIDAGLIKQVSNFSIDGSQHLIANYNDGTSTDLGAIFSGNITVSGYIKQNTPNYTANINFKAITGIEFIKQYCVFEEINGVVYVIVNVKVKNVSGSNINLSNFETPWLYINASIGANLIDLEGYPVTSDGGNYNTLIAMVCSLSSYNNVNGFNLTPIRGTMRLVNVPSPNACAISFEVGSTVTLQPDESLYYSARMPLTLI